MSDRSALLTGAFLRALATGMAGVVIGLHLAGLGFAPSEIGLVVGSGLGGTAGAALVVTLLGDRIGHRRAFLAIAALGTAGGLALCLVSGYSAAVLAAFVGMVNGMGRDRGPSSILDQAILPATGADRERTGIFARYNVVQDLGHAAGSLLAGLPSLLEQWAGLDPDASLRVGMGVPAGLTFVTLVVYARLSPAVEAPRLPGRTARLSAESRSALWRISGLFAVDSLGGGLMPTALLTFFFHERFGAGPVAIGLLFFGARVANTASHLAAAWLAARIGLVNTMVFTHIPSSLLLVTVAFAPSFPIAALLFLLREGLVEMDVPTRQSYVMAIVRPEERVFASGVTNLVRLAGWAVAPGIAGLMMRGAFLGTPLILGAAMKIGYDVALYAAFRHRRPPEERAAGGRHP